MAMPKPSSGGERRSSGEGRSTSFSEGEALRSKGERKSKEQKPKPPGYAVEKAKMEATRDRLNRSDVERNAYNEDIEESLRKASELPGLGRRFVDAGGTPPELQRNRRQMLDEDPDTFWQVELSYKYKNTLKTMYGDLLGVSAEALEKIRDRVERLDPLDLIVSVVIDMTTVKPINWISLMPMNFREGLWLEVLDVETAIEQGQFVQVPNLSAHMNESVLTPEANEDLSPWEAAGFLTESKGFSGQGLWVFPVLEARYVRFTLRQALPVPSPYTRYQATVERDVTQEQTKVVTKKRTWRKDHRSKHTETTELHLTGGVELDYEQSVLLHSGESAFEQLMTGLEAGDETTATMSRHTMVSSATNWECTDMTEVVLWDMMRYAIGIREVQIQQFTYEEASTFVSTRYKFPKAVMKIALDATELIPEELKATDRREPWIAYYVSLDDSDWYAIAPISYSVLYTADGTVIPQIINVDSELPEEDRNPREFYINSDGEPYHVRLKAVFSRPGGEEFSASSPILKSYRVKAHLWEGLY